MLDPFAAVVGPVSLPEAPRNTHNVSQLTRIACLSVGYLSPSFQNPDPRLQEVSLTLQLLTRTSSAQPQASQTYQGGQTSQSYIR